MKLTDIQIGVMQFVVICIFFYIEALIHYNIGKTGHIAFNIPSLRNNCKIIGIITVFAALSTGVTYLLKMWLSNSL